MKKRMLIVLLSLIAMVMLCLGLTACGKQSEHTHSYGSWVSDSAETHTRECSCGDTQTQNHKFTDNACSDCGYINSTDNNNAAHTHSIVEIAASAPTCTKTGLTDGSCCSACNEVIQPQQIVQPIGHAACEVCGLCQRDNCDGAESDKCIGHYNIVWKNSDMTDCYSAIISKHNNIPEKEKEYSDDSQWVFNGWNKTQNGDNIIFTEKRKPNEKYLIGNVFQIVGKDLGGQAICLGSGFVINNDGWFITNNHVMADVYKAEAIFEIPNRTLGESFTRLNILYAKINSPQKDFFLGKIENYGSIASYYRDIGFSEEYSEDDVVYSAGYPNSSVKMSLNDGVIITDYSRLEDKLLSGVTYIAFTSYTAHGSSGGVLFNDNLEVVGITTLGYEVDGEYLFGGAISYFNFMPFLDNIDSYDVYSISYLLHTDEEQYVKLFLTFDNMSDMEKGVLDENITYTYNKTTEYKSGTSNAYSVKQTHTYTSNFFVVIEEQVYWANGDNKNSLFYGIWSPSNGLNNFYYDFTYKWSSGISYSVKSHNINYSQTINLTLQNYTTTSSAGYTVSADNITYAKVDFNTLYESVYNQLNNAYGIDNLSRLALMYGITAERFAFYGQMSSSAIDDYYYTICQATAYDFGYDYYNFATKVMCDTEVESYAIKQYGEGINAPYFKVGVCPNYSPFEYISNNEIVGFDIDLMMLLTEDIDGYIEFIPIYDFDSLLSYVNYGIVDCVISAVEYEEERANNYLVTSPYLVNDSGELVIYCNKLLDKFYKILNEKISEYKLNGNIANLCKKYDIKEDTFISADDYADANEVYPSDISLNMLEATIYKNDTLNLVATVSPYNARNKYVTWSSSNTNVAVVENGVVTGKNAGTATITATTVNGIKTTCLITVKRKTEFKTVVLTKSNYKDYISVYVNPVGTSVIIGAGVNTSVGQNFTEISTVSISLSVKITGEANYGGSSGGYSGTGTFTTGLKQNVVSAAILVNSPYNINVLSASLQVTSISGTISGYFYVD